MEEENVTSLWREYAVDGIVRVIGKGNKVKYVVRWYGYTSADDTVEPPVHIPEQLFTGFCSGV